MQWKDKSSPMEGQKRPYGYQPNLFFSRKDSVHCPECLKGDLSVISYFSRKTTFGTGARVTRHPLVQIWRTRGPSMLQRLTRCLVNSNVVLRQSNQVATSYLPIGTFKSYPHITSSFNVTTSISPKRVLAL